MKTLEHWTEALSRLDEKKFFEIARNFLGIVKTPYNKQALIEKLISFFSNTETQEAVFSFLSKNDIEIINAVELFQHTTFYDIEKFFSPELNAEQCSLFLTSLEERLLVYVYFFNGQECYALNPVFEERFKRVLALSYMLFPCRKKNVGEVCTYSESVFSKRKMLAFFSFVHSENIMLKSDNTLSKKIEEKAESFFSKEDFFDLLKVSITLKLLQIENSVYTINIEAISDFFQLPEKDARLYLAAGLCGDRTYVTFLAEYIDALTAEIFYSASALRRIMIVLLNKNNSLQEKGLEKAPNALYKTGFLQTIQCGAKNENWYNIAEIPNEKEKNHASIIFNSPFSFIVLPDANIFSILDIIYFSEIEKPRETEYYTKTEFNEYQFVITKETVVHCYECGKNSEWIIERLKSFSSSRVEPSLSWALTEWENRFNEVFLQEGAILYLGGKRAILAETDRLKPYLGRKIGDNVFVINPAHKEVVRTILKNAGIDIIGSASLPIEKSFSVSKFNLEPEKVIFAKTTFYSGSIDKKMPFHLLENSDNFADLELTQEKKYNYKKQFLNMLSNTVVDENAKHEIISRINHSLVVSAAQLKNLCAPGTFPYEKNEARGLDYAGKLMIAKTAFSARLNIDVLWMNNGKEESANGVITGIEKSGTGDIISVEKLNVLQFDEKNVKIPLAKVVLLRKNKHSIFD